MNPRTRRLILDEWQGTKLPKSEEALAPADLRVAFQNAFKRLGLGERFREATLVEAWPDLVGPILSAHCCPRSVRRSVLYITVDHPAWLHQVTMVHKKNILSVVQKRFPHLKIRELALRVGSIH